MLTPKILKTKNEQTHQTMDGHLISFLVISDDKNDAMALLDEFRKNKIINPLSVEHHETAVLEILKQRSEENLPLNTLIILLDVSSPGFDGFQILKSIYES